MSRRCCSRSVDRGDLALGRPRGGAMGGPANLDEYTQWKWVTVKDEAPMYPF
jgi:hypothetical protein